MQYYDKGSKNSSIFADCLFLTKTLFKIKLAFQIIFRQNLFEIKYIFVFLNCFKTKFIGYCKTMC